MAATNLLASVVVNPRAVEREANRLLTLYARIPDTFGCMASLDRADGCGAWCCRTQNPQVLRTEFRNSWLWVTKHFTDAQIVDLIGRALRNYLSNEQEKGCVFWDAKSKLCSQHPARPFACRTYGIMSEEEWKPRYERLRVLNPNTRPQCDLVQTADGQPFTKARSDEVWAEVLKVEVDGGVPAHLIHDGPEGTYRTFHDHLVLSLYPPQVLNKLTEMKLHASPEEKERFIATVLSLHRRQPSAAPAADPAARVESAPGGPSGTSGPSDPSGQSDQ